MEIDVAAGEAHLRELDQVRRRCADYFATPEITPVKWRETVLLVGDHYRGRRFDFAQGSAVWSPGEESIAILRDGKLQECLPIQAELDSSAGPLARAA